MADHSLPTNTSTYSAVLTNLKDRMVDQLRLLDPTTTSPTNVSAGSYRINGLALEKYSGTAWASYGRWLSPVNDTALGDLGLTPYARSLMLATTAVDWGDLLLAESKGNLLHNAGFDTMQLNKWNRDPTFYTITSTTPVFLLDRWAHYSGATGTHIQASRESDSFGLTGGLTLRTMSSNTTTPAHFLRQRMPVQYLQPYAGKKLTFSVEIPSSTALTAATLLVYMPDGSTLASGSVLSGATVTFTLPAAAAAAWQSTTKPWVDFVLRFNYSARHGSVTVKRPMLNIGASASPYKYRNDAAICQLFYQAFAGFQFSGVATAGNQDFRYAFPLTLGTYGESRTIETFTGTSNLVNCTVPSVYFSGRNSMLQILIKASAAGSWLADYDNSNSCSGFGVRLSLETY